MKLAVIHTEDAAKWAKGYELYINALGGYDAHAWRVYKAYEGELPGIDDGLDGVIISGSHYNTDQEALCPWMTRLYAWLRAVSERGWPRVVGICYGAQAIAAALVGLDAVIHQGFFEFGAIELHPTPALTGWKLADGLLPPRPLRALESHGCQVSMLPKGAVLLAHSARVPHEIFATRNMLAFQCHPEFDVETSMKVRLLPFLRGVRLNEEETAAAEKSLTLPHDSALLIEIMRRFLTAPPTADLLEGAATSGSSESLGDTPLSPGSSATAASVGGRSA